MNEESIRQQEAWEQLVAEGPLVGLSITVTAQPAAQGDGCFLGTCLINGTPHHIALIPVEEDADGRLQAIMPPWDDKIDELMLFDGADSPYQTITDEAGGEFICAITPYCT